MLAVSPDSSNVDDLMGLEDLVANTAYLNAQHIDQNELRRLRLSVTLPKPKWTSALRAEVGRNYESLCEQQPIGRKLFRQFLLATNLHYAIAVEFLEELNIWSFAEDETKEKVKRNILAKFCHPESMSFLSYLAGEAAEKSKKLSEKTFNEVVMGQLKEATRDFLKGRPFSEYLKSPYFYRFLQWKEHEKQKISDRYFYEFRTLGRGGFGEVCTQKSHPFIKN